MRSVTKKWVFLKISSLILIPLIIWFILSFIKIYDQEYLEIVSFFNSQPSKLLFGFFLVFLYFFSALSISEVFEDYIPNEKIKNAANKFLYLFAITCPILTVIIILNL